MVKDYLGNTVDSGDILSCKCGHDIMYHDKHGCLDPLCGCGKCVSIADL